MCNTYVAKPKRGALGLAQRVSEATAKLKSALVRKSDPGVVVRDNGRVDLIPSPRIKKTISTDSLRCAHAWTKNETWLP